MKKVTAYKCDKCDYVCISKEAMQRHEAKHDARFIEVSLFLNLVSNELRFGEPYLVKTKIEKATPILSTWVGDTNDSMIIEWSMDCENTPEAIEATRYILRAAVLNWAHLMVSVASDGRIKDLNKKEQD